MIGSRSHLVESIGSFDDPIDKPISNDWFDDFGGGDESKRISDGRMRRGC